MGHLTTHEDLVLIILEGAVESINRVERLPYIKQLIREKITVVMELFFNSARRLVGGIC